MWKQVREFEPSKMGKQAGWCLQNCRLGFGIPAKYATAGNDAKAQIASGTLHEGTPPSNISVPVYFDVSDPAEHVVVWHKGVVYEDGKVRSKGLSGYKMYGWGELCDGVRVVEFVPDPRKTNEELAKEVIKGLWGSGNDRKQRLTSAGYDYSAVQAIVNEIIYGKPKEEPKPEVVVEPVVVEEPTIEPEEQPTIAENAQVEPTIILPEVELKDDKQGIGIIESLIKAIVNFIKGLFRKEKK